MQYLIVGYGNIGHKRAAVLGKKCVATVDIDPKVDSDFKDSKKVPQSIIDSIDAVNIAVPRSPKLELVEYWLNKKKHVIVEKPLILSPSDLTRLKKIASKNNVIWYTAYNIRFEPNIVRIKKLIDSDFLGKMYHGYFEYSYGNSKQLVNTWRNAGYGALDEIGCHLIDFATFFFGYKFSDFELVGSANIELKAHDYFIVKTKDNKILIKFNWLSWKNVFKIDLYGEKGSLHMDSLCKWGKSELITRKRILPAGVPLENKYQSIGPDQSWKTDFKFFENLVKLKKTSEKIDTFESNVLYSLAKGIYPNLTPSKIYEKLREDQ